MSEELKPCPFCRALEPQKIMFCDDLYGWIYRVQCVNCKAMVESLADMEKAIQQWNTRPAEEALKAEVERLKDRLERFRNVLHDVAVMANDDDLEQIFEKCRDVLRDVYLEEKFQKRFSEILHGSDTAEKWGDDE